jgi:hypothetical protein
MIMSTYIRMPPGDHHGDRAVSESDTGRTVSLNALMEFEHVIRVHDDGSITEPTGVYAPELTDDHLDTGGHDWSLLSGYSDQHGYRGPGMHSSEYVGGKIADHILTNPGYYVVITADYSCDCPTDACAADCEGYTSEGWAVAFMEAS